MKPFKLALVLCHIKVLPNSYINTCAQALELAKNVDEFFVEQLLTHPQTDYYCIWGTY
jgi:hypothetical protein